MDPFHFSRVRDVNTAIAAYDSDGAAVRAEYLAGGTSLIDLMKLGVVRPQSLIDINDLQRSMSGEIKFESGELTLGALVRMSTAADHADIQREFPVVAQSLRLAASAQLRNMASLAGNILQRTRCTYFRDISYQACNKRAPGSGCSALDGVNRQHAILGVSDQCIAAYPGDFAQALLALDARVNIVGRNGARIIPLEQLHRPPADRPDLETTLANGEMIVSFLIPATRSARRSRYLKIRDRESYEFALASAAVVLDLDGEAVRQARIALGGVATTPWRAREAEALLAGKPLSEATLQAAANAAFADARPREMNAYKVELGKRTMIRALRETAMLEI